MQTSSNPEVKFTKNKLKPLIPKEISHYSISNSISYLE